MVALLVVLIWGIVAAKSFLVPMCLSALLAFLISPIVRLMRRYRVPEWLAITLASLILILPIGAVVYFIVVQGQAFVQDLPHLVASLEQLLQSLSHKAWVQRFHLTGFTDLTNLVQHLTDSAGHGLAIAIAGLRTFLEAGTQLVLILVFAIVMLASREHLRTSGERILASFEGIESANMLDAVSSLIEQFLIARLLIVVIVAAASILTLRLFGVSYAFLLGAIIGVLTVVPELGFWLSIIPPLVVCAAGGHSLVSVLALSVVLVGIHLIEGNILTPKMVGSAININILATFVGLFAGGLMWGVWGMFLSVPILGILRIALSAAPTLRPWGTLLAEHEDHRLTRKLRRQQRKETSGRQIAAGTTAAPTGHEAG